MEYKRCTACGLEHPITAFYTDKRRNKPRSECMSCYRYKARMRYKVVEVKAPTPRVNVWEWIKRLFG